MLGALGNRELAASLVSSTLPPGTTRGAKGPSLTLSAGAFEGSLSMSLILSPWRGGGSLPSSLLGGGWVVVEGAVGSNNLNRDGVGDGEGNGDGGDSRRGTNHAAAGTRDGEDIDDRREEVWRKVLAAGLVLRGAGLWLYRAGLGLSGGQRGIVKRKAVDGMWEYSRPGQRWLCDGRLGGVGGGCV